MSTITARQVENSYGLRAAGGRSPLDHRPARKRVANDAGLIRGSRSHTCRYRPPLELALGIIVL